jgi:hypothetical protein
MTYSTNYRSQISHQSKIDGILVLADALEQAGVAEEALAQLRSPGPHVRGCHVVTACLGLA